MTQNGTCKWRLKKVQIDKLTKLDTKMNGLI